MYNAEGFYVDKFYVIGSIPLEVTENVVVDGKYATEEGHIIRVNKIENDSIEFDIIQGSELVYGELITSLNVKLLKLFWTLMKNNYQRGMFYED